MTSLVRSLPGRSAATGSTITRGSLPSEAAFGTSRRWGTVIADRAPGCPPAVAAALVAGAGYGALVVAALVLGIVVRDVVGAGSSFGAWDLEIARALAEQRSPVVDAVSYVGTHLAGQWEVPVLTALLVTAFAIARTWWAAGFLVIGILLDGALYLSVTYLFVRARPPVGQLDSLIHTDSFPSGHAMASVVVYTGVAIIVTASTTSRAWRTAAWTVGLALPLLVGWSRTVRGMHYATDVLAGYLLGFACLLVAWTAVGVASAVADRRMRRRPESNGSR